MSDSPKFKQPEFGKIEPIPTINTKDELEGLLLALRDSRKIRLNEDGEQDAEAFFHNAKTEFCISSLEAFCSGLVCGLKMREK